MQPLTLGWLRHEQDDFNVNTFRINTSDESLWVILKYKPLKHNEVKPISLNQQLRVHIFITVIFLFLSSLCSPHTHTHTHTHTHVLKSVSESDGEMRSDAVRCDTLTQGSVAVLFQPINSGTSVFLFDKLQQFHIHAAVYDVRKEIALLPWYKIRPMFSKYI